MISSACTPATATLVCMINIFMDRKDGTSWLLPIPSSHQTSTPCEQRQEKQPPCPSAATPQTIRSMQRRGHRQMRNIFNELTRYGHDKDFELMPSVDFPPTDAPPGSPEKIDVLRSRIEQGLPLWHPLDRCDCICLPHINRK